MDIHDLEASGALPEQPSCLITPLTSRDNPTTNFGASEGPAEDIGHEPDLEHLVKKKARKGRMESSDNGVDENAIGDVAQQPAADS